VSRERKVISINRGLPASPEFTLRTQVVTRLAPSTKGAQTSMLYSAGFANTASYLAK